MDIVVKRIIEELKAQKKTQSQLAEFIGVTTNVITDWKSGRIKSYKKYLHGIAEFLGVSVEYLQGKTDIKEKSPVQKNEGQAEALTMFTPHELMVIAAYRAQPAMQAAVDKLLGIDAVAVDHPQSTTA